MKRIYEITLHEEGAHKGYYVVTIDGCFSDRSKDKATAERVVQLKKYFNKEIKDFPKKN